ncbi:MAG: hypothetical protein IKC35_05460, partial [Clostridia bacterium]|nr:hypothetical protein [Clostridia bacterium]
MKNVIAFLLTVVCAFPFMCCKSNDREKDVVQQEKVEYFEGASQISETNEMQISAADTTVTSYDTFLEAYYRGLTQNFGHNYQKSCGYVALGMLLSYYDTYLDDDII